MSVTTHSGVDLVRAVPWCAAQRAGDRPAYAQRGDVQAVQGRAWARVGARRVEGRVEKRINEWDLSSRAAPLTPTTNYSFRRSVGCWTRSDPARRDEIEKGLSVPKRGRIERACSFTFEFHHC